MTGRLEVDWHPQWSQEVERRSRHDDDVLCKVRQSAVMTIAFTKSIAGGATMTSYENSGGVRVMMMSSVKSGRGRVIMMLGGFGTMTTSSAESVGDGAMMTSSTKSGRGGAMMTFSSESNAGRGMTTASCARFLVKPGGGAMSSVRLVHQAFLKNKNHLYA